MLANGLGLMPDAEPEKSASIVAGWQAVADNVGLPLVLTLTNFFTFVGGCKVAAPFALWGAFGGSFELLANFCLLPQLAGAVYTHQITGEPLAPPAVFLALATVLLIIMLTAAPADGKAKAS